MIAKSLLLAFASPFVLSASIPETITFVYHPAVVQVICDKARGTAFRVGSNGLISVNHVTRHSGCKINGEPVQIRLSDVDRDVSFGRISDGPGLKVNCDGFKEGEPYFAIGHANGAAVQRLITVVVSPQGQKMLPWRSFTVLAGAERYIPGMSGGPVLNRAGEVVGTVNGLHALMPLSYSQSLSETAICTGRL